MPTSIISSMMGSSAASDAANAQLQAANKASKLQWKEYQQTREDTAPWRTQGQWAVTQMGDLMRNPSAYTQSPGYLFRLGQGLGAQNQAAAANGMLLSGQQGKALTEYGQNFATNDYDNQLNRLAALAGYGQTAVGQTNQTGMNAANNMSNLALYGGQARATGYMNQNAYNQSLLGNMGTLFNLAGGTSAITNGLSSLGSGIGSLFGF